MWFRGVRGSRTRSAGSLATCAGSSDSRRVTVAAGRWGYDWSEDEARKTILRTHTTAVSARTLYEMGQESAGVRGSLLGF